jgi:tetratricopeptide (TPR) repeat protein
MSLPRHRSTPREQHPFLLGSDDRDVGKTLAVEPRHFVALAGLGNIYLEAGKEQDALKALEKALAVHPHLWSVKMRVDHLTKKFRGTPI